MHRNRHLMIGLSLTDTDAGLIRYAAMVARLGTAAQVAFVHVIPGPGRHAPAPAPDRDRIREAMEAEVRDHFAGVPESVPVRCDVLEGPLLDRLLAAAAAGRVDLLLIGHRRDHPGRWALARRLAMKATCSVWMVPQGSSPAIRRLLVPVDFSAHSADTLRVATSIAQLAGLPECLVLHDYFNAATLDYEGYAQVVRSEEDRAFRHFIAPIDCHGVRIVPLFEEGSSVAQLICRVAERCGVDLIVMTTRGRSRSAAVLLGCVTEEVIVGTRIPLLVVKHAGAQMNLLEALLDKDFLREGNVWFD